MSEFALKTKSHGNEDQRWIGNGGVPGMHPKSIVLDRSLFDLDSAYPNGYIPSGVPLGKVTATGLYGPYSGADNRTEESVTFTEGGSGLTSWTITYNGHTTGSLDDDATAADVLAALEALDDFAPGDLLVTRTAVAPSAWTVTASPTGSLKNTDLGSFTTTPTGGSGSVAVAVATAGGAESSSDGRQVLAGHLFASVSYDRDAASTADLPAALFWDGEVVETYLPNPVDANGKTDVAGHIKYVTDVVGA